MSSFFGTLWTLAYQAPLSVGLPRQEYGSGSLCFSLADLPNPGTKPVSPALAGGFFTTEPPGKPSPAELGSCLISCFPFNWLGTCSLYSTPQCFHLWISGTLLSTPPIFQDWSADFPAAESVGADSQLSTLWAYPLPSPKNSTFPGQPITSDWSWSR